MNTNSKKLVRFQRRRNRSKRRPNSDLSRLRLVVFRSAKHIYGQIVDDNEKRTLVACSTVEKSMQTQLQEASTKMEQSQIIGKELAKRAVENDIKEIVFDRNGFIYHGRIKAFADAARSGGLNF
ncbi:MAG: 50S ribosomal protein L18 [Candidatus Marinimicrobia bacterium]|nr:50S ribosomal protein L18 [Candidatus Neomarinimicrobiota bacterium]